MSGAAGGTRIPRAAVEQTVKDFVNNILSKIPGFKSAKISGSYNQPVKQDFGDIDLVVSIETDQPKKEVKKMIVDYFEGLSDKELPYLNTEKHKGKKAINHGEIISNLYPISGMPGEFVQVDNIIAVSESEGDFKKVVLDYPAEIQGLILGLVKTPLLEEDPEQVFKRMGIKDVPSLGPNQEYEFHLDTSGLSLKIVTLDENYRQLDSNVIWESTSWEDVKRLLKDFNLDGTFQQFIEKIKKFKNPRSKNRVKGFFKTSIKVGPAEKGTPKGDGKQQALDTVAALQERYGSFVMGLIRPLLLEQEGTIAIFPGKFKPPHKDHLARIQAAAKIADQVRVIIGPNPVAKNDEAAVSAQESLAIFDLYKKKNLVPDNVTFEISDIPSPVLKAYQEFEANPEQKYVAIFGKDDAARFKGLAKMPNVTINNFPEANIGDSSATDLRKAIAARDIAAIKQFLPFGVSPSEYLDALNMPEKEPLQETYKGKRTKDGAPGTLKAKISKLYGGDVTIEKARKLKNRENATPHDKRQANWFINFHSKNESITPAELKQADDFADSQLAPIDVDLTSKHVFDRLTGRESDISLAQLIGFFKRLGRNKKQFIDFFNRYQEIVANDKTTNLNIPFLNLTNKAIAKTIMRKSNFLSSSPKLTFEEEGKAAPYGSGYKPLEEELAPYIQDLTKHMYNQGLSIDPAPEIEFVEDQGNAKDPLGKTAYYDPNKRLIVLYVTGRHPKDILRSFAHEMIHHCQNLEGRLGDIHTTNVNEDDYLKSLEREAYERGNMSFRSWENSLRGDNGVRYIKGFAPRKLKENLISETMTVYRLGEIPNDEESFFVTPDYKTWIKFYPGEEIHKITTNKLYLPLRSKSFLSWDELRSKYNSGEFTDDDVSYINPEESGIQDFEQYEIKPDDIIDLEQINLEEGRKNKPDPRDHNNEPIMTEGKYDSLSNRLSGMVFRKWKEDFEAGNSESHFEQYIIDEKTGLEFDLTADAEFVDQDIYSVDGGANAGNQDEDAFIHADFKIDIQQLPGLWEKIAFDLKDFMRHEIEHLTQQGTNLIGSKKRNSDQSRREKIKSGELPTSKYPTLRSEIEPMLQGMYFSAKKQRRPFIDVINDWFESRGFSQEEKRNILKIWKPYLKQLSLPKF